MPRFVWTAKDKCGKSVVREVTAETIEESKSILLSESCTELELKEDDYSDAVYSAFEKREINLGEDRQKKIEERIKYLGNCSQNTLGQIFERVVQDKGLYLLLFLLVFYGIYFGYISFAIIPIIVMICWLIFRIWLALPEIYYAKINKAKDWHQWAKMFKLVRRLERIQNHHFIKVPFVHLTWLRAQALAGLRRLPEALTEFQKCENQPGMPSWIYKAGLAVIYDIVKDYEKGLEYTRQALEEKKTPTIYLDMTHRLLSYKKDTLRARQLLEEVEKITLNIFLKPFYIRYRGILEYLEGNYTSAQQDLEASLEIIKKNKKWPFRDGNINMLKSYLCCVLAKQGDLISAKKYFKQAEKYLIATGNSEFIDECKKAIGN